MRTLRSAATVAVVAVVVGALAGSPGALPAVAVDSVTKPTSADSGAGLTSLGYMAKEDMTVVEGNLTITTAGTVLKDTRINGRLIIQAANVTAENVVVAMNTTGTGTFFGVDLTSSSAVNFTGRFMTIYGAVPSRSLHGIGPKNYTLERSEIYNVQDGARAYAATGVNTNVRIRDNYFHDLLVLTPDPGQSDNMTHADGIHVMGGNGTEITGNRIAGTAATSAAGTTSDGTTYVEYVARDSAGRWMPATSSTPGAVPMTQAMSSIMVTPNVGQITNILIAGNWLGGGTATINAGSSQLTSLSGSVTGNRFVRDTFLNTGSEPYSLAGGNPLSILIRLAVSATAMVVADNTYEEDGAPARRFSFPAPSFTSTCSGLRCTFNAGATTDDGTIVDYAWTFGDGTTGTGVTATHDYTAGATYTVRLTVTDDMGGTASTSRSVTVTAPPPPGTLAQDSFQRTVTNGWGTAPTGGTWTVSGTTSRYAVSGGVGTASIPAGVTVETRLAAVSSTATDLRFDWAVDRLPVSGNLTVTASPRRVASSGSYLAKLVLSPTGRLTLALTRVNSTGGSEVTLQSAVVVPTTVTAGGKVSVRVRVTGTNPTTIQARVWAAGTTEPTAWQRSVTDRTSGLQAPGGLRLTGYLSAGRTAVQLRVDDLVAMIP